MDGANLKTMMSCFTIAIRRVACKKLVSRRRSFCTGRCPLELERLVRSLVLYRCRRRRRCAQHDSFVAVHVVASPAFPSSSCRASVFRACYMPYNLSNWQRARLRIPTPSRNAARGVKELGGTSSRNSRSPCLPCAK